MLSGLPNFVYTVGYTNVSWTLKADLVAEYACRLLNHMDANGHRARCRCATRRSQRAAVPGLRARLRPALDRRAARKQGSEAPWRLSMSYIIDVAKIRHGASTTACCSSPSRDLHSGSGGILR